MSAKTYLKELQKIDTKINQKIHEVQSLRLLSNTVRAIDYSDDRVQTSPPQDAPYADTIERICQMEEEINSEIDRFVEEKHVRINQIQSIEDVRYIQILYGKYIRYRTLEDIAEEMGITYRHCTRLHGRALQVFETKYGDEIRKFDEKMP